MNMYRFLSRKVGSLCIAVTFSWLIIDPCVSYGNEPVAPSTTANSVALKPVIDVMDGVVAKGEVAGSVTVVVSEGQVKHLYANGLSDIAAGKPMQDDTIFWIASMSKPVTGACMMILVDEGKVALDDPITKYLPEMKALRDKENQEVVITIRQLLSHTSGMSEPKFDATYTFKSLEEAASTYSKLPVMFAPGSKWQYSQTSINTAARIVEVCQDCPLISLSQSEFVNLSR